ncbi:beta-ketoacyl-[acyl-carrier-protein] synthase family protein [bacterium]|nr:beta-ketoacyl-[acyl-carrier-protein] synthase family protein [bacterium]
MNSDFSTDPVVITGLGVVSPWGGDRESSWQGALAGQSMAKCWELPDQVPAFPYVSNVRWIGCPAATSEPACSDDPVIDLALRATRAAMADASLPELNTDRHRWACVFGTSKGSLTAVTAASGQAGVPSEEAWNRLLMGPALAAQAVAGDLQIQGPVISPVAACATGLAAVLRGAELLKQGDCDLAVVGSADDSLHPLVLASFQRLGVLAQGRPDHASRPFDRLRNGFVIGAGAGTLILERRSSAEQRGAPWYAEIVSGAMASDPTGLTTLEESGALLARLIGSIVPPGQVPDVINLHGTGTRLNDAAECRAICQVFGDSLRSTKCLSLKGGMGHLLGAAGSVELALSCLMLRDQLVPPNVNLDEIAEECRLPLVQGQAQRHPVTSLLKLSLGFGGHQAAVWLNRGTRDRCDNP